MSEQPNGATQARLHVVLADAAGPRTDLFVDGAVAINGGQRQVSLPVGYVTAYLYLAPGSHQVAVAPTGGGIGKALAAPIDVPMVAGRRYLVAFMGQVSDGTLKPLVVDETAVAEKAGEGPGKPMIITLNNLTGSTGIDYEWAGKVVNADIPLGGYGAGIYPAGNAHIKVTAKGATDTVLIDEDNFAVPCDSVFGIAGSSTTSWVAVDSGPTCDLNLVDSLRAFDASNLIGSGPDLPTFDTLLAAIKTAGMSGVYSAPASLLFLAPTDKAFAAMAAPEREALLRDPAALAKMLRADTIEAYVPRGSLAATPGGTFDRTFTNLLGNKLTIGADFTVNGGAGGNDSYWLANGTQVHPVDAVTLPPAP